MPDLSELLAAEAASFDVRVPPVEEIVRRRRTRVAARSSAALACVAVAGAVGFAALQAETDSLTGPNPRTAHGRPATPAPPPQSDWPSQAPNAAARDGVLPAVAALPFADRVGVVAQEETSEGIWAVSRMPGGPGTLGDTNGRYGVDWVQRAEYGELLLLDPTGSRILRAVPLPGVPPQTLVVHDTAVYCARQGDGGLPDSMLCRADRNGSGTAVRIFAAAGPDPAPTVEVPGWQRQDATSDDEFAAVVRCPAGVCVEGPRGTVPFHPATLVLPYDRRQAADTAEACSHVETALVAQERVTSAGDRDWEAVESALYAAERAGRASSDPIFVRNLTEPGSFIEGDTQTLGDVTDRLGGLCGLATGG